MITSECNVDPYSSRVCDRGTRSCLVDHAALELLRERVRANEPSGHSCSECSVVLRWGPFGGPDNFTDYTCEWEDEGCEAHTCIGCIGAHERRLHDGEFTPEVLAKGIEACKEHYEAWLRGEG